MFPWRNSTIQQIFHEQVQHLSGSRQGIGERRKHRQKGLVKAGEPHSPSWAMSKAAMVACACTQKEEAEESEFGGHPQLCREFKFSHRHLLKSKKYSFLRRREGKWTLFTHSRGYRIFHSLHRRCMGLEGGDMRSVKPCSGVENGTKMWNKTKKTPTSCYSIVLFQWVGELALWAKAPATKPDTWVRFPGQWL